MTRTFLGIVPALFSLWPRPVAVAPVVLALWRLPEAAVAGVSAAPG